MLNRGGILKRLFFVPAFALATSCGGIYTDYSRDNPDPMDRPGGLSREDYTKSLVPRHEKEYEFVTKQPPLPTVSEVLLAPQKPKLGINKTVTLSVTDEVPLKDVFIELARLADIDIEVDHSITGGIIFKAKNKPFDEVVERIAALAQLRYKVNNGVLRIERDVPYVENYYVNFPNITRSNSGSISVNTAVLSSSGGGGGGGSSSGGSSGMGGGSMAGGGAGGAGGGGGGGGLSSGSSNTINSSYDGDVWASVTNDISAIIGTQAGGGGRQGGEQGNSDLQPFISVNRQAGMITVATTQKNHLLVADYLNKIAEYTSAQVLIEAKIVEVDLNDQFRSGINWAALHGGVDGFNIRMSSGIAAGSSDGGVGPIITIDGSRSDGDITSAVQLANAFGVTRTLSSPRVLVMNNQQAILSFAENRPYFTLNIERRENISATGNQTGEDVIIDPQLNTVPLGLILTLQPSINTRQQEIMMNIRPTLSKQTGEVTDPTTYYGGSATANIPENKIPIIQVREMDSLLKLKSGEIMVIGGMIDQAIENNDTGVPYISEVPLLGNAFKRVEKTTRAVQTIIFLKATIVPGYGVEKQDQQFYHKFQNDPRPIAF